MAERPVYNPHGHQNTAYEHPGAYPQRQPVAFPQGQPGIVYPPGQVVITQGGATHMYQPGSSNTSEHYNGTAGLGTGIVHLIVAILCIILGGVAYVFPVYQIGYGIWSAFIFYIPTGILGIASKKKNSCVIIAYMVMAILSTFHAFGMIAYEAFVATVLTSFYSCYYESYYKYTCDYNRSVK
ncbi:uncharacterized protein LOC105443490 [Strongylocentrotus purpuratus]|uniref:Uncharacterized protein n=1 Tax=Strongylocentrotus purpuratus TaxID=7668 RepID=A0A7M7P5P7_STRPU|nr:uncharacterized protein LOC105443490 [Strongylocentrotus purpuratus]